MLLVLNRNRLTVKVPSGLSYHWIYGRLAVTMIEIDKFFLVWPNNAIKKRVSPALLYIMQALRRET